MKLLSAVVSDTTGASFQIWDYSQSKPPTYRPFTLLVTGTFGGGTAKVQVSNDNSAWVDAYSTTSAVGILFESTARFVRGVLTGSTSPSLTMELT